MWIRALEAPTYITYHNILYIYFYSTQVRAQKDNFHQPFGYLIYYTT